MEWVAVVKAGLNLAVRSIVIGPVAPRDFRLLIGSQWCVPVVLF